jgi:hypothetical protein
MVETPGCGSATAFIAKAPSAHWRCTAACTAARTAASIGSGLERFALAGNVNDWIERIGELAELGASRLWLSTEAGDLDRQIRYMKVFTEEIMPHFR